MRKERIKTMREFMNEDFLLENDVAKVLYENYAQVMPIIDYHCHIEASEIAENKKWENITQLWLGADHYKWRAMRSCGVSERLITGDATDYEKFEAFCSIVPYLMGNPIYHWSHLELKRYFDYDGIIRPETCDEIWNLTKEKLESADFSAQSLVKRSNVALICTTNDPTDSLVEHIAIKEDKNFDVPVIPAFRPDKCLKVDQAGFKAYIEKMSEMAGVEVKDYSTMLDILAKRIEYFDVLGCRTSDHSMEDTVMFDSTVSAAQADSVAEIVFKRAVAGEEIDKETARIYRSSLIRFLGRQYSDRDWIMQIHFGALRNVSDVMFSKIGPDSGYDMIHGGSGRIASAAAMLNALEKDNSLPKTVLYSLNPAENTAVSTLVGCFQHTSDESEGLINMPKMQQGCAWWFNDHLRGIKEILSTISEGSALGKFIGMTTDSRSFLSYTRHEYFRRILCSYIGDLVEKGNYPMEIDTLAQMVCDICYNNAKDYFGFKIV